MTVWNDLRFAARLLARERGFTIAAVMALAIGMSATILMFTIIHGVYLRDMPFADPDRIVAVETQSLTPAPNPFGNMSFPDLQDLQASARLFDGIGATAESPMDVSDDRHPAERVVGASVTANAFSLIGQRPALGRDFTSDDDRTGAEPVVILGHAMWQRRYGGDPRILGERLRINGVPAVVVGVMPEGFGFPTRSEMWQPLGALTVEGKDQRDVRNLHAFGRMAPGVTLEQATADLAGVMDRLGREYPDTNAQVGPRVRPYRDVNTSGPIRTVFAALMGAGGFLLLIGCANVANLLLARGATRAREITVRLSLGATRRRIVAQLLAESLLLALVAGAVGLALAAMGVRLFQQLITGTGEPYWLQFPMEARVFAFVAAVCLGTAVLCGLTPALHTVRIGLAGLLNEGRGTAGMVRAQRWTDALVVIQLASSLTLLTGASLMMRNVMALSSVDAGVDVTDLLVGRLNLPEGTYPTGDERRVFYRRLGERLAALPGIRAGLTSAPPLGGAFRRTVSVDGRTDGGAGAPPVVSTVAVGAGYLEMLGVRPVRGRLFTDADEGSAGQLALVNERFAAMHFAGEEAVGRVLRLQPPDAGDVATAPLTIVGVVPDVRQAGLGRAPADVRASEPVVYIPHGPDPLPAVTIVVRSAAGVPAVASALRDAVRAIDPDLPVLSVMPLSEAMREELRILGVFSSMFGGFATVALGLAVLGLYAVTAYAATRRTREVGVRIALGARARHVWWLVTRRAAIQMGAGTTIGLAGALGVGQLLGGLLWGVSSRDPVTLIAVPALLVAMALVACIVPARRAMRVDPVAALRAE